MYDKNIVGKEKCVSERMNLKIKIFKPPRYIFKGD